MFVRARFCIGVDALSPASAARMANPVGQGHCLPGNSVCFGFALVPWTWTGVRTGRCHCWTLSLRGLSAPTKTVALHQRRSPIRHVANDLRHSAGIWSLREWKVVFRGGGYYLYGFSFCGWMVVGS